MAPKSRAHVASDVESSDDEGVIKNLDYKPPKDFTLYKAKKHTTSLFDVDETVTHELWLIRVPDGVSNEDLATMSLTIPQHTSSSKDTASLGSLKKKESSSTSSSSTTTKYQLQTVSPESGLAGEMLALEALVPDSSKGGRLVQAPRGIQRHLALVAQPTIPSGAPLAEEILSRPIPKRTQPEGLKMRFKVSGFDTQEPGSKLSGSGKEFAARWAKTLEKRQQDQEEELLRAQQAQEDAVEGEEGEEEEEETAEAGESENDDKEDAVIEEEEQQAEAEVAPAKKRKAEQNDAETDASEEKKIKKEKKEKKDKKDKKDKKTKKE